MNSSSPPPPNADKSGNNKRMGLAMLTIAWILIFGMLLKYFFNLEAEQLNPNRDPTIIEEAGRSGLVLEANRLDHYVLTGKINGRSVTLLLDTGATNVAVPEKMAKELGLEKGRAVRFSTANGFTIAYQTSIDVLELGNIKLLDVEANISPGMNEMDGILLGMSALSRIEFSQKNGQLILTQ